MIACGILLNFALLPMHGMYGRGKQHIEAKHTAVAYCDFCDVGHNAIKIGEKIVAERYVAAVFAAEVA